LDHLGIVAGVCQEIGLAEWLDAQDTQSHERVSAGTATVAMIVFVSWDSRCYLASRPHTRPGVNGEEEMPRSQKLANRESRYATTSAA
jgi:hypothetical protein